MSAHTPGPWRTHKEGEKVGVLTHDNVDHVATCYGFRKDANARLMASAPDFLAILQQITEDVASWQESGDFGLFHERMRANAEDAEHVIAKATGGAL